MKPNEIDSNDLAQAIGYVIAANSLFDVPGRPSPVGVLSDFIDQWYLIWIGKDGEVFYAATEKDLELNEKRLTRLTALYYKNIWTIITNYSTVKTPKNAELMILVGHLMDLKLES